jgi:putative ABC transport system ATP-binding protein
VALLELSQIEKQFYQGEVAVMALQGIDLTLERGEFAALVGPSGSGKTTLLNLVGALDRPTAGSIRLDGVDLALLSDAALADLRLYQIGFIFQAYNLVPVLSAQENVELIMLLQGRPEAECRQRARHYLDLVALSGLAMRRPAALSGGEQQRVAVARALAASPRLVLADEPTANLDSANATALLDLMATLASEEQTTFLFSTHDPRVMARAKRIITLQDGRLVSDSGRP